MLIVFPTVAQVVSLPAKLAADEKHQKAAKGFFSRQNRPIQFTAASSVRCSPIEGMPKLEKPDTSKPRLLNLRIYESHNERAAQKKVEMFNKHELAIFRRVGLTPGSSA